MVHNFFKIPHVDGVYWTLEVELLFYAGMFALYRKGLLGHVLAALWVLLGLRLAYYLALQIVGVDLPWRSHQLLILGYIPWFAIGICAYLTIHPRDAADRRGSVAVIAAALALLTLVASLPVGLLTLALALLARAAATQRLQWLAPPSWCGWAPFPTPFICCIKTLAGPCSCACLHGPSRARWASCAPLP